MSSRETFKIIDIGDKKYRLEKFDALTGSYMLFTLMQKFLPSMFEQHVSSFNLPAGRSEMSKEEFQKLQADCLSVVSVVRGSNTLIPVIDMNGYLQEELQKDTVAVVALTVHSLKFNLESFFEEDNKKAFESIFQDLNLAAVPT